MSRAREEMVAAAERIAVERGLGAMSLREVQAAAGQRNKSAAQYHFGSREGLVEAVVELRMGPVNARRQELLAALDPGASRQELVEAFVVPLAEHTVGRPGSRWARFVFQGLSDPALHAVVARCFEGASFRDVHARLVAGLDHVPEPLRTRRVDHVVALVVMALASAEAAPDPDLPTATVVTDLVATATAVLDAPAPQEHP